VESLYSLNGTQGLGGTPFGKHLLRTWNGRESANNKLIGMWEKKAIQTVSRPGFDLSMV
jgi:hypothetical protein